MNLRALTISQAVQESGLPRPTLYRLLESGEVAGNRAGNRWYVSAASLAAWINRTPEPVAPIERAFPETRDRFA